MKKTLILIPFIILIVSACSKDQKVVKQLEGDWKVVEEKVNGIVTGSGSDNIIYHFEKCKVKNENCDGSLSAYDSTKGTYTMPYTYNVTDDGTKITFIFNLFGVEEATTSDILEHSRSKMIFSDTDINGDVTETTLEKQ